MTRLRATATDDAGNVSDCSAGFDYDEDSTAPPEPTITGTAPESPSADNTPTVFGETQGPIVRIYAGTCAGTAIGGGLAADFEGATGIDVLVPIAENQVTQLRATATDRAGNVSGCSELFAYTEDSTAPVPPTITETNPPSGLLTPSPEANPLVIGGAEAGSTVSIYNTACTGGALGTETAAVFGAPGISVSVAEPITTLHASAVDDAGNESGCSEPFNYYLRVLPLP